MSMVKKDKPTTKFNKAIEISDKVSEYIREIFRKELDVITFDGDEDSINLFSLIVTNIILYPIEKEFIEKQRNDYISVLMDRIETAITYHERLLSENEAANEPIH